MPIKKYKVKTNSSNNLEDLLNEIYNESCMLLLSIQNDMNKLTNSTDLSSATIEEKAKFSKAQHDFFTDKDKALKMKLDIAKIMNEILKFSGDESNALNNMNKKNGTDTEVVDIRHIQKMINEHQQNTSNNESKNYSIRK